MGVPLLYTRPAAITGGRTPPGAGRRPGWGYKVFYREAHTLIEEINEARELGELRKYRAQLGTHISQSASLSGFGAEEFRRDPLG